MRTALILAIVLSLGSVALADDGIAKVVKDALECPEPTTSLLRGFASLGDVSVSGREVAQALRDSGAPTNGIVAQALGGVARVNKHGDTLEIVRASEVVIPIVVDGTPRGWVKLGNDVKLRVRKNGGTVVLDDFEDVKVGPKSDEFYPLKSLQWTPGTPTSRLVISAGWGILSKTLSFDIPSTAKPRPAPAPVTVSQPPKHEEAGLPPPTPKPATPAPRAPSTPVASHEQPKASEAPPAPPIALEPSHEPAAQTTAPEQKTAPEQTTAPPSSTQGFAKKVAAPR